MMRRAIGATLALAGAATAAHAEPRRGGMTGGGMVGGGLVQSKAFGQPGLGVTLGAHLGWLAAGADGRLGAEVQLFGSQFRADSLADVDGVLVGALRAYPHRRVALTLGLGVTAAEDDTESFVAGGAAFAATAGVELNRWRRASLSLQVFSYGGRFDEGTWYHLGVGLGVDFYGLSTPPR